MALLTVNTDTERNLRASRYCRTMPENTYRAMIQFMDSRMAYLLSQGVSAYDACVILYNEIRLRYGLPVPPVTP